MPLRPTAKPSVLACALRASLVAALITFGPAAALAKEAGSALEIARELNQAFIEVAEKVSPSVVVIRVAHKPDYSSADTEGNPFFEWLPPQLRKQFEDRLRERQHQRSRAPVFDAQGSGIVIRSDGYILTNGHVVEGADKIQVRFKNGQRYDAEVRGTDPQSDVAVIKIEAQNLPVARLADSSKVRVGEFAIAVGAPFDLDYSVTFGHVSATGRSWIIPDPTMDQDFIQTDANINPGNSGGPLVNIDGEVIGINTLIRGLHTGIGFAIPSDLAREVADKLIANGKYVHGWLGIEIRALADFPEFKELNPGLEDGVVVMGIVREGPAANSELRLRDVIVSVDGKRVNTAQDLKREVRSKRLDRPVSLDVVRERKHVTIKVTPAAWPEDMQAVAEQRPEATSDSSPDLGLTVKPLTRDLAKEYGVSMTDGLLVTDVASGSPAERQGLQRGDVITQVNQSNVTNLREYRAALKRADLKRGVIMNLTSQGLSKFVVLKDTGD